MQDALVDILQSSLLAATDTQDQVAALPNVQDQMLQNVACTRFGPALIAAKSQDDNSLELEDSIDSDADWDVEVGRQMQELHLFLVRKQKIKTKTSPA